eukprot:10064745-Lingulodinium_polyedra.AAC.1
MALVAVSLMRTPKTLSTSVRYAASGNAFLGISPATATMFSCANGEDAGASAVADPAGPLGDGGAKERRGMP